MQGSGQGRTEEKKPSSQEHLVQAPAITLPKGGGIRGIDEKFSVNAATGTASLAVPIFTTPGRSGFYPQISLSYDSGAGNGPFGLGWNLSIPAIARKTDKGVPLYRDAEDSDTFVLSGAEDLVPVLVGVENPGEEVRWERQILAGDEYGQYQVERYRPRIEGLFARIERWQHRDTGDTFWRAITRDNVTSLYGTTAASRITDPADPSRVFQWLLERTYDDRGNLIRYKYKQEDDTEVDRTAPQEANRLRNGARYANRYPKRIWYGNQTPYHERRPQDIPAAEATEDFLFEVVFDYGEHAGDDPTPLESNAWAIRQDPFSTYRAGFEMRTQRLCKRVLMFHHFTEELGPAPCLVRSTAFEHDSTAFEHEENRFATYLVGVTQTGYRRPTPESPTYIKRSLPKLQLDYSRANLHDEVQYLSRESLVNLPAGVYEGRYQWVDLDGEGIPGVLTETDGAWLYKRNLGQGNLASARVVATIPSLVESRGSPQLLDLAGDGSKDLVLLAEPVAGFYERDRENGWTRLTPFRSQPQVAWDDPNLRFVDLDGDGHADILISEEQVFTWYPSLAEDGFGAALSAPKALDEEQGPAMVFADASQSVYLADMSGDGLVDIARIRNGEVSYWPNLGHGRFGAKVTMAGAPWFESPDLFDPRRIRLADIDGYGTTDIVYLGSDAVSIWRNQAGNSWHERERLTTLPRIDNLSSVAVEDILGNGTACLVWSSPLPADSHQPLAYIDLMGLTRADPTAERQQKPHLLVAVKNNLGAETHVTYASSTKFYLDDEANGQPWITRLPFPVQVVERVETLDRVSRNRFVTRSAYHHGYYDGIEREFRGFGMVEQRDTEEFAALTAGGSLPDATNIDATSHVPPVLTKTWFHTGAFLEGRRISRLFEHEYYREGDPSQGMGVLSDEQLEAMLLDDTIVPSEVTAEETPEACRSLKGVMLRQEVYANDRTEAADRPYVVSETNYTIKRLQPRDGNRHAVFFTHAREAIQFQYERKLYDIAGTPRADPRVSQAMTLDVDDFGNVKQAVAVAYGRRHPDPELPLADQEKQGQILATLTENRYTNAVLDRAHAYRTPLPAESRTFELLRVTPPARLPADPDVTNLFRFGEMQAKLAEAAADDRPYHEVRPEEPATALPARRLIEHVRSYHRSNDLTRRLALGELQSMALPFETYKLAFTPGLVRQVYRDRVNDGILQDEGHYVHTGAGVDDGWWIPSGRIFYSPGPDDMSQPPDPPEVELPFALQHFFLAGRYVDPFGQATRVTYDSHDLIPLETTDALNNQVSVGDIDYRMVAPRLVTDPNGNRAAVTFDALGLVVGTAVMGKPSPAPIEGDSLDGFEADLELTDIRAQCADPPPDPLALLGSATSRLIYDLDAYRDTPAGREPQPSAICTIVREKHHFDPEPGPTRVQRSYTYSDGFGREIQKKVRAEPGPLIERGPEVDPRWVGSGWTVFNNKGKPVRQYEPFFDDTCAFRFGHRVGVSPILFYDPVGRAFATLHPNHTWEKVVFDPWRQEAWDVNDTVTVSEADLRTDPAVGAFFSRLPDAEYLPTWHDLRTDPAKALLEWPDVDPDTGEELPDNEEVRRRETDAARKAAAHAGTPTVAFFDTLDRSFLTIAHNRFQRDGSVVEEKYPTRVELDIEGNQRAVRDAKQPYEQRGEPRLVMRYDYDMLGDRIHQASMEAGERWLLNDVAGKPIRAWDSRGHQFRTAYDRLRRPTESYLSEGATADRVVGRSVYGERRPNPEDNNLRGKVVQVFDQAGVVTSDEYDFKGNLLRSSREVASGYKEIIDWAVSQPPGEQFSSSTTYDALNRPETVTAPDGSVIRPTYNEANLLEQLDVNLPGGEFATPFVTDIDYSAKGQRTLIEYGNGASTTYDYDPATFRLTRLRTTRNSDDAALQDLRYTYDPAGNITHIRDDAQQTIYFNNRQVEPSAEYTYDAIYRLIEATGREHLGLTGGVPNAPTPHSYNDAGRVRLISADAAGRFAPNDGNAVGGYRERYVYDEVGNFQEMQHLRTDPANSGWTRTYDYDEPSLIEDGTEGTLLKTSNRLSSTQVGNGITSAPEPYAYDAHGNMLSMPHLQVMQWDFRDQLQEMTRRQRVNDDDTDGIEHEGERTWYVYDSAGQRVRKVTERQGQTPTRMKERIYLGGFEVYREYENDGDTVTVARETLLIMDDKQRLALVETRTLGDEPHVPEQLIRYQFGNHLRSASLELDDAAQIVSYEEYTPYGSTSYQAVRSDTEAPKRYRYTGMERDEESGLNYHTARYYAPWLARWVSADPYELVDGVNLYRFAGLNPTQYTDEGGTSPKTSHVLPKVVPIREGMIIGDYQGLSSRWTQAVQRVLEKRYGGGSYAENLGRFQQELKSLPRGSNRAPGTAVNLARRVFTSVGAAFRRSVALPAGTQIHHAFEGLAANPASSLNASNLEITHGQAGDPTSTHSRAHRSGELRGQPGVRNPGVQATQGMEAARRASAGGRVHGGAPPETLPPAATAQPRAGGAPAFTEGSPPASPRPAAGAAARPAPASPAAPVEGTPSARPVAPSPSPAVEPPQSPPAAPRASNTGGGAPGEAPGSAGGRPRVPLRGPVRAAGGILGYGLSCESSDRCDPTGGLWTTAVVAGEGLVGLGALLYDMAGQSWFGVQGTPTVDAVFDPGPGYSSPRRQP